jgi:hypothetical protein
MDKIDMIEVLEGYFNETNESYNIIILPSAIGGYGPKITDTDGKNMIYACLSTTNMIDNIPYLDGKNILFYV